MLLDLHEYRLYFLAQAKKRDISSIFYSVASLYLLRNVPFLTAASVQNRVELTALDFLGFQMPMQKLLKVVLEPQDSIVKAKHKPIVITSVKIKQSRDAKLMWITTERVPTGVYRVKVVFQNSAQEVLCPQEIQVHMDWVGESDL